MAGRIKTATALLKIDNEPSYTPTAFALDDLN